MRLIVVGPMLFGAENRDSAVWTFEAGMGGGQGGGVIDFAGLRVVGVSREPSLPVGRVRTVCMLFDESGATADRWGRGVGEGMKEIIRLKEDTTSIFRRRGWRKVTGVSSCTLLFL